MAAPKIKVSADADAEVALQNKIIQQKNQLASMPAGDDEESRAARQRLSDSIRTDETTLAMMKSNPPEPNLQTQPQAATPQTTQAPAAPFVAAPGASLQGAPAMFKSPETLQKIAELMSAADSGKPIESIMEEIQKTTGLEGEAFWKELHAFVKEAEGNPFVDGDTSSSEDKKGGEEKSDLDEEHDELKEKGDSSSDKAKEHAQEHAEEKEEKAKDEDHDEAKKDDKSEMSDAEHQKLDKKQMKVLDKILDLAEELLEMEKDEGESHAGDVMQAINILKQFKSEEKAEHGEGDEDMAKLEKQGPDLPPEMEGMAVPLPDAEDEGPGEMKVIEIETKTPFSPAFAGKEEELAAESKAKMSEKGQEFVGKKMKKMKEERKKGKEFAPGQEIAIALSEADKAGFKGAEKKDKKASPDGTGAFPSSFDDVPKRTPEQMEAQYWESYNLGAISYEEYARLTIAYGLTPKPPLREEDKVGFEPTKKLTNFNLHDRVWRKADYEQQFETVGDEAGRVVAFGNGKVIVDWGDEDGIPTEEVAEDLVLASEAAVDGLFDLPKQEAFHSEESFNGTPTGINDVADQLLKQTSLHEMLAKAKQEVDKQDSDTVTHIASGKQAKVLERMADSQMKISLDGREFVVWNYEVK